MILITVIMMIADDDDDINEQTVSDLFLQIHQDSHSDPVLLAVLYFQLVRLVQGHQ